VDSVDFSSAERFPPEWGIELHVVVKDQVKFRGQLFSNGGPAVLLATKVITR